MTQAKPKTLTFEEFVEWKPENGRYELRNRVIVEMQPSGKHEAIIEELSLKLSGEILRQSLPYRIPKQALVKQLQGDTAYSPDVLVRDTSNTASEPLWEKYSTLTQARSIPLVVEVVSTNWRDDYFTKAGEYEAIGIPEYWIVNYLGLGGRRFIGNPKQPTISIYTLVEGEYQVSQFRSGDAIASPTFPELNLTAQQLFEIGD